jgi:cytochrome b561
MNIKLLQWTNTADSYGIITKAIHWLSAMAIVVLFALGYWMVDLSYYSEWYQLAPHWHESIGVLLLIVTFYRVFWRWLSHPPQAIESHRPFEKMAAKLVIAALFILLFTVMISGYLITSADGRAIEVFTWFELYSFGAFIENQEDIAGDIHYYLAYALIGIAVLHALAAIKHHFIDKDLTLKRMLK